MKNTDIISQDYFAYIMPEGNRALLRSYCLTFMLRNIINIVEQKQSRQNVIEHIIRT